MEFHEGPIAGVIWRPLRKFPDARGWLCELFRDDELADGFRPAMAYLSESLPDVSRGPHEHVDQTDCFCFLGPGNFRVVMWDNRPNSPTFLAKMSDVVGQDKPMQLVIPPGVVHAYTNLGPGKGLVFNAPDRLYRGPAKKEPIDEIRHEDDPQSPFRL